MIWRARHIEKDLALRLAAELGQPQKIGEFLTARGFKTADGVRDFIRADLKSLPSPRSLTDMDKATERLVEARRKGELTAVCGDYDADGLTAAALLVRGFKELGLRTLARIPDRLTEGYGLKPAAVTELAGRGVALIVTVDNGATETESVELAGGLGLDVIITDHHRPPPRHPPALAVINPHRDPVWSRCPLTDEECPPAGVGVAFLLLTALKRRCLELGLLGPEEGPALLEYLSLVAIGAIADLAPLRGANRILVRQGLKSLAVSSWPGLAALKKVSGLTAGRIGGRDVGFKLAPRLNAPGRLESAEPALALLLAETAEPAARLAAKLNELNRRRCQEQNRLCEEVLERLELELSPDRRTAVLGDERWSRGLLGLAAARVAEKTRKPTTLFRLENGLAVGSGRSCGNFDLHRALSGLSHMFLSFGGHAQAAGLTLPESRLEEFSAALEEAAQAAPDYDAEPELKADLTVSLRELETLAAPLAALEPYGPGNPPPVMVIRRARIEDARLTETGGGAHLKLILVDGLTRLTTVGFNLGPRLGEAGPELDVALSLEMNEYRGRVLPFWRLLDFAPPDGRKPETDEKKG